MEHFEFEKTVGLFAGWRAWIISHIVFTLPSGHLKISLIAIVEVDVVGLIWLVIVDWGGASKVLYITNNTTHLTSWRRL